MENFVLGGQNNQTILIHGLYETEMFAEMPKYFTVPLTEMKPPGKISFRTKTPSTKFTVHASYSHNMPSENDFDEELTVTDVHPKIIKIL